MLRPLLASILVCCALLFSWQAFDEDDLAYGTFTGLYSLYYDNNDATTQQQQPTDLPFLSKLSADNSPGVLNIHVVPHTHDDVGWRKTVEQYYYGYNNSIDTRGNVRDIITTAIQSLSANPARVFTYVEMKFFSKWWDEQDDATRDLVRFLIANQQLFFVNGGWCMHDEASTHYTGMIDQTTMGHDFLRRELGVKPTIGWQLDPFGHSYTHAELMVYKSGMKALYFGRIDYQDLQLRQLTRQCEGLWNTTSSGTPIFWGLTGSYGGNYNAPPGFCFDVLCDDELLVDASVERLEQRIHTFLELVRIQSDETQGNHVMLTMGADFTYSNAHVNYANLDILISTVMNYQSTNKIDIPAMFGPQYNRVNIFYSTPEYYTDQKLMEHDASHKQQQSSRINWQVKQDDFFPYSDCANCFWSGYFTSRTNFKRFERVASAFLMAVRQLESIYGGNIDQTNEYYELEDALGVVQHHDAVSGTAKQHVADDYSKRLQSGLDKASKLAIKILSSMFGNTTAETKNNENNSEQILDANVLANLTYCQLLNESICAVSEEGTISSSNKTLYVVVYNSRASEMSTVVRLPVSTNATYTVERLDSSLTMQALSTVPAVGTALQPKDVLMFDTGMLPPVGAAIYRIVKNDTMHAREDGIDYGNFGTNDDIKYAKVRTMISRKLNDMALTSHGEDVSLEQVYKDVDDKRDDDSQLTNDINDDDDDIVYTNNIIAATFNKSTGQLKHVSTNDVGFDISQEWGYYTSFDSNFDKSEVPAPRNDQNSGAYIFRPSTPDQALITIQPEQGQAVFYNTSVGFEVHVSYKNTPWIKQVLRVLQGQSYIEVEYSVGPIPIDDGRGKEIVTRYTTPLATNATFYTDSNGRRFIKRTRNSQPTYNPAIYEPIAGNYYPVNAATYIQDSRGAFCVAVDRSQGGASIIDGSLELMVHRRTLADDARGVDEALNETMGGITPYPEAKRIGTGIVTRGIHRLLIGKGAIGASLARSVMDGIYAEPLVFVASVSSTTLTAGAVQTSLAVSHIKRPSFSGIAEALPPNVMLITYKRMYDEDVPYYIIRLGHQYDHGEDEILSSDVTVNINALFSGMTVESIEEMTLTANQKLSSLGHHHHNSGNMTVTISPMDIRTYKVVATAKSKA